MLLQPLRWRCVECVIHHERDVREEQKYVYVAQTSNNRVIMACDLYCCLLPQCEALRICRSGFPITTILFINTKFLFDLLVSENLDETLLKLWELILQNCSFVTVA